MNEELKTEIIEKSSEILAFVENGIKTSADFVTEQAPILIQEILAFGLFENLLYAAIPICLIVLFGGVQLIKLNGKRFWTWVIQWNDTMGPYNSGFGICMGGIFQIPLVVGIIMFFTTSVPCLITAGKIVLAPRLYLLEYMADLTRSVTG